MRVSERERGEQDNGWWGIRFRYYLVRERDVENQEKDKMEMFCLWALFLMKRKKEKEERKRGRRRKE